MLTAKRSALYNITRLLIVFAGCLLFAGYQLTNRVSGQDQTPPAPKTETATPAAATTPATTTATAPQTDDAAASAAFTAAAAVFLHPRCVNCHTVGNMPFQTDKSTPHKSDKVQRGPDGRGVPPFKCTMCHKEANKPAGPNPAPGAPDWRMPTTAMPMVFEKKTPAELCRQLKDEKQNGGKTLAQLVEHIKKDPLVLWGWNPGLDRTKPPLSQEEFAQKMEEWVNKGAACPQ